MTDDLDFNATIFVDEEENKIGSMDYALPSLYEGMQITIEDHGDTKYLLVKSWKYNFSKAKSRNVGLIVTCA